MALIFFLQKGRINYALSILHLLVKRAEEIMRCIGKKYRKTEYCFDEECMEKKNETKERA
jgi:hypothetical protein